MGGGYPQISTFPQKIKGYHDIIQKKTNFCSRWWLNHHFSQNMLVKLDHFPQKSEVKIFKRKKNKTFETHQLLKPSFPFMMIHPPTREIDKLAGKTQDTVLSKECKDDFLPSCFFAPLAPSPSSWDSSEWRPGRTKKRVGLQGCTKISHQNCPGFLVFFREKQWDVYLQYIAYIYIIVYII